MRHLATAHAVPEPRCPHLDCWSVDCPCGMHEEFHVAHGPAAFDDPELQFLQAEIDVHNSLPDIQIRRERVSWSRWDPDRLRTVVSHPTVWLVEVDGDDVKSCDTKREAVEYAVEHYGQAC